MQKGNNMQTNLLTGAIVAKQRGDLTRIHVEIQMVHSLLVPKCLGQIPDLDSVLLVEEGLAHRLTGNVQILLIDVLLILLIEMNFRRTPVRLGKEKVPRERCAVVTSNDAVQIPGQNTPQEAVEDERSHGVPE